MRTPQQSRDIYKLLNALGIKEEDKKAIVMGITKNRTEHTSEMTILEAREMIEILTKELGKKMLKQGENRINKTGVKEIEKIKQRIRRTVFVLMYDLGVISNEMDTKEKIEKIEQWIKNHSDISKSFNSLQVEELEKIIRQLQAIRRIYVENEQKNCNLN